MGMGCIGMSLDDFERCTPLQFEAIYNNWQRRATMVDRGNWERARMECLCVLQPYSKKSIQAKDVMRFPWDDEPDEEEEKQSESNEDMAERYEKAKKRYGLK